MISLRDYQREAVDRMTNGCVLAGEPGSGKSRTSLAYYYKVCGGDLDAKRSTPVMKNPIPLVIITTAKKRDDKEWESELEVFRIPKDKVSIDSWNNVTRYDDISRSFFIFDEQRAVGSGPWSKSFVKIAKHNQWIMLSATPGDNWKDYIPLFVAHKFYKTRTEFTNRHFVYSRFSKFPQVVKVLEEDILYALRDSIIVDMDYMREVEKHHVPITTDYDVKMYKQAMKRWNVYENKPIKNAGEYCYILRRIVNSDPSRIAKTKEIVSERRKVIIFYNFDYELDMLKASLKKMKGLKVAEWNGHQHDALPTTDYWAYLVQYTAGCEGWNCVTTDTMIFYSQNYSWRTMKQAEGRTDRMNSPFKDLYYYHLQSKASIDMAIQKAIKRKKKFNERSFTKNW